MFPTTIQPSRAAIVQRIGIRDEKKMLNDFVSESHGIYSTAYLT